MKILSYTVFCTFLFLHCVNIYANAPLAYVIDDLGKILPIYNQEHLAIFKDTCPHRTYMNNQTHFFYSEEAYYKGYPLYGELYGADSSIYSSSLCNKKEPYFTEDYRRRGADKSKNELSHVSKCIGAALFCYAVIKWCLMRESKSETDARKQSALFALYKEEQERFLAGRTTWQPLDFLQYYDLKYLEYRQIFEKDFLKDEIYSHISLYRFGGFRELLIHHPKYEEYMEQIREQIAKDPSFFKSHYKAGEFEGIIAGLWSPIQAKRDALEKEQAARVKMQQQQEAYSHKINTRMKDIARPIIDLYQIADFSNLSTEEHYQKLYKNRKNALTQHNRNCDAFKEKTYQLLDNVQKILNEYSMQAADFAKCYGNMIQQALHEEFLGIMSDTAQLRYVQDHRSQERRAAATTIMGFVQAGNTFKNTGYIPNAIRCADICWSFLECQKFLFNVMVDVSLLVFQTVVAGTKGVVKGTINGGLKIIQPVRTFEELVVETTHLSALVEESFGNGFKDRQMRAIKLKEQRDQDAQDLELGLVTHEDLLRRDLNACKEAIGVSVEHVRNALGNVLQNINRETYLHGVEKVTEIGTEAWLTGVTLRSLSGLVKNGSTTLSDFMNTGGPKNFYDLPLNGKTFGAMVAYESTIADVAAAHGVQVVGGSVAEALDKISQFAPVLAMSNGSPGGGSNGNSGGGGGNPPTRGSGNIPNPPHSVLQESKLDAAEQVQLVNKFDGIRTYNGQPIKLSFIHAFKGEVLSNPAKIGGLHHDILGYLRQKGFIRNIRMHSHGFYTADVYIGNGIWVEKTFFPELWSREQVAQCVINAFDNPYLIDIQGKYVVFQSNLEQGVDIRFVFESLTGEGKTFYPLLY